MGTIAARIYDDAFMAVSYLRAAQNGLMTLSVDYADLDAAVAAGDGPPADEVHAVLADVIPVILSDLEVARDRVMSPAGERATAELHDLIMMPDSAHATLPPAMFHAELDAIQARFDTAVEIYAGDGYLYRRSVGTTIDQVVRQTRIAMGLSVLIALVITYLLSRSIGSTQS